MIFKSSYDSCKAILFFKAFYCNFNATFSNFSVILSNFYAISAVSAAAYKSS